jgi:hypothetical protein
LVEEAVHDTFVQIRRKAASFDPVHGIEARSGLYAILRDRALPDPCRGPTTPFEPAFRDFGRASRKLAQGPDGDERNGSGRLLSEGAAIATWIAPTLPIKIQEMHMTSRQPHPETTEGAPESPETVTAKPQAAPASNETRQRQPDPSDSTEDEDRVAAYLRGPTAFTA